MASFSMGIEYAKLNGYTIYQFENKNAYNYFLAIPDHYAKNYQMFIGFPKKELKDLPRKDVISEIDEIKKMITYLNHDGIYLLPDIPVNELEEAARENDGKKYNKILNERINPMIQEAYQTISSYKTAEKTINQVIVFVKQTESDRKFVDWFEMNMPNFIHGVTYEEIKKYYYQQLTQQIGAEELEKERIFNNPTKDTDKLINERINEEQELTQTKQNVKVRKLVRPSGPNNYGFSNIFKMLLTFGVIIGLSIIIGNIILR